MPYEIETKDGIVLRGIPDDVAPDHESVKAKVTKARAERDAASVTSEMSGSQKFITGIGMGMNRVGRGVGQVLGIVPQSTVDEAVPRDAALSNTGAGMAGDIVGNLAVTAPLGLGAGAMATKAASVLPAAVAPTVAAGAAGGAVSAATAPVQTGDSRTSQAAIGAAGGAVGDLAMRSLARVAQPITQNADTKKLLAEGIVPTIGQAAGANSTLGRLEQKLQSVPLVGDIIKSARDRATGEFNVAAINRALPKNAQGQVTEAGREAIRQADHIISQGYDDVLAKIGTVKADSNFYRQALTAIKDPDLALPAAQQEQLRTIIKTQVLDRAKNGEISADIAKRADSIMGTLARRYGTSPDGDQRALASGIREVQSAFRQMIERSAAPEEAAVLRELNTSYANFLRVERAASYVGADKGVFTASQLQNAVRALDPSKGKRAFAEGRALMQDLSEAGKSSLGNTVNNSGSADRYMIGSLLAGGANSAVGGPGFLTALLASPLAYSRAGSRYAIGDLSPAQQIIAEIARNSAPAASQVGRAVNEKMQNR
jgi:hypothetical protein